MLITFLGHHWLVKNEPLDRFLCRSPHYSIIWIMPNPFLFTHFLVVSFDQCSYINFDKALNSFNIVFWSIIDIEWPNRKENHFHVFSHFNFNETEVTKLEESRREFCWGSSGTWLENLFFLNNEMNNSVENFFDRWQEKSMTLYFLWWMKLKVSYLCLRPFLRFNYHYGCQNVFFDFRIRSIQIHQVKWQCKSKDTNDLRTIKKAWLNSYHLN